MTLDTRPPNRASRLARAAIVLALGGIAAIAVFGAMTYVGAVLGRSWRWTTRRRTGRIRSSGTWVGSGCWPAFSRLRLESFWPS